MRKESLIEKRIHLRVAKERLTGLLFEVADTYATITRLEIEIETEVNDGEEG